MCKLTVFSNKMSYICDYCQARFTHRNGRYKHMKSRCKKRYGVQSESDQKIKNPLMTKISENIHSSATQKSNLFINILNQESVVCGSSSQFQSEPNNSSNPSLIQLLLNQQKQIEIMQKQLEEDKLNRQKQIEEDKLSRQKLEEILLEIKDKPCVQNVQNVQNVLIINNYFNPSLDLYDLTLQQKGFEFAQNYYLTTIHKDKKYFDPIMKFLIEPDFSKSPIRLTTDNVLELHRSPTLIENDDTGDLLQKDTQSIISKAYLKAFNQTPQKDLFYDSMDKNFFASKLKLDDPDKSKLRRNEAKNLQTKIFDGEDGLPSLKSLHVNLGQIEKYKITAATKKKIIHDLSIKSQKI